jgi:hypothetical protein
MTIPVSNTMLTDYIHTLLDIATEQCPFVPGPVPVPVQTAPVQFLTELFRYIATNRVPISRAGTDNLMDVLFETMDLPDDASHVTSALDLPTTPPAFQAYWTHIVLPAWEQLTTLKRVLAATSTATSIATAATAATATEATVGQPSE